MIGRGVGLWLALAAAGLGGAQAAGRHALTEAQARRLVVLVAHHDGIDLRDSHIELNSMDLSADFIPGFASFIVIRESVTPGPDETLRRFAVNRRTADVWEMTLCTHYDFPELRKMQTALSGRVKTDAAQLGAQSRELGCSERTKAPTS